MHHPLFREGQMPLKTAPDDILTEPMPNKVRPCGTRGARPCICGQLVLRDAERGPGIRRSVAVGVLAAPAGLIEDEQFYHLFREPFGSVVFRLEPVGLPGSSADLAEAPVTGACTRRIWSVAESSDFSGQILLRRAALPGAPEGHETFVLAGIVCHGGPGSSVDLERLHAFTIDPATGVMELRIAAVDRHQAILRCRGSSAEAILQAPIWSLAGCGQETDKQAALPWGLRSTLRLPVIRRAETLRALRLRDEGIGEPLTQLERARMRRLDADPAISCLTGSRSAGAGDGVFMAFRREMARLRATPPLAGVRRADEIEGEEVLASKVLEALLSGESVPASMA